MFKLLDTSNEDWNKYLNNMKDDNLKDIYFSKEYYNLYENNDDGIGKCFIYTQDDKIAMYPFMLNEIKGYKLDNAYYDIETAYGYGGPIANTKDEVFIRDFEDTFINYCCKNNIIAEFIRFHPFIKNENIFSKGIQVCHNRTTVYIDLKQGIEGIWNNEIKSKDRNMIRKAEKNGLRIIKSNDYNSFKNIYEETMDKVQADKYYYFSKAYYDIIKNDKNYNLLYVIKDDIKIAAAIFMVYGKYCHYHLAGSNRDYLKYAPNNFLLWEAIKLACNSNAEFFHLGGGLSNNLEDNLFKFKSSFSKSCLNYYIGKRIHNKEIYNYLISQWEKKSGEKAKILLQYKY